MRTIPRQRETSFFRTLFCEHALMGAATVSILLCTAIALAQTETVLYRFTGSTNGGFPQSELIRGPQGNLFGSTPWTTTQFGSGSAFKLTPSGDETILADGTFDGGLVRDSSGNFYAADAYGGDFEAGAIVEITAAGVKKTLYSFTGDFGGSDGALPNTTLVRDSAGDLFGTAIYGGTNSSLCGFGCGEIFELSANGNFTQLYSFIGLADGRQPVASLVRDKDGNLYGTTYWGGGTNCGLGSGCGVVFKLSASGAFSVLHTFDGDGAGPAGTLILDAEGNLYGATSGDNEGGSIFKIDSTGSLTTLFSFTSFTNEGSAPRSRLLRDKNGNLYGTTVYGGSGSCTFGCGVVFEFTKGGVLRVLHNFAGAPDGAYPLAGLTMDANGDLFGTTSNGGLGYGTIFRVTP